MDRIYAGADTQCSKKDSKHCCFACSRLSVVCHLHFMGLFFLQNVIVADNFCYVRELVLYG